MFVSLHRLSRAKVVSKKSIATKSLLVNSPNFKLEDEHYMLSLDAYAWYAGTLPADGSIPSGVRYVLQRFVPAKVFGDTYK